MNKLDNWSFETILPLIYLLKTHILCSPESTTGAFSIVEVMESHIVPDNNVDGLNFWHQTHKQMAVLTDP